MNNFFKAIIIVMAVVITIVVITLIEYRVENNISEKKKFFGNPEYRKNQAQENKFIQIGKRKFEIPAVYIRNDLRDQIKQDAVNLIYVLPDFTPRTSFPDKASYDKAFKENRFSQLIIQDATEKLSISEIIENRKKNEMLTKYSGEQYGLKKYVDYDSPKHPDIDFDDTYIEFDTNGNTTSFISCKPENKVPYPTCKHYFSENDIFYTITYNKNSYLASWQDLRRKAVSFLTNFEIKPTAEEK